MKTAKAGAAYIANISFAERRRRLGFGIVTFALGVAAVLAQASGVQRNALAAAAALVVVALLIP